MDLGIEDGPDVTADVDVALPGGMKPRDYQLKQFQAVKDGWGTYNRMLGVGATGTGKTILFSMLTADEVRNGGRVLIVAHTEELLDQAADKLAAMTGLPSDREKADEYASPDAHVVIASIQTLSKTERLKQFPVGHFSLMIVDEAHRSLARSYLKVMNYYHFGEQSLDEAWLMPEAGVEYKPRCRILGVTATADRGDRRSLGQFYQHCVFEYGLIDACRDGYLVRPVVHNIPLQGGPIDIRGVRSLGGDLDAGEIAARLSPFLHEIACHVAVEAKDRKTIIFLPSIDAASRLADALVAAGMPAWFVSGACPDRAEKISRFRAAPIGTVICNAMVLTEGFDAPDVSCVCVLRPTKIRSLFVQCTGRASRPLPGIIDGLEDKGQRLAAIAASAKPDMLILDFLWLSDRLDLVKPVDLMTTRPDLLDRMAAAAAGPVVDLLDLEGVATRDLLKSLEAAAKKNANKERRVLDPLAWAVDLGDDKLATYEPETAFDRRAPTKGQIDFLEKQKFDVSKITCFGQASALIGRIMMRYKHHLATPAQLHFMHQLGFTTEAASGMTIPEASAAIDARMKARKQRADTRPAG